MTLGLSQKRTVLIHETFACEHYILGALTISASAEYIAADETGTLLRKQTLEVGMLAHPFIISAQIEYGSCDFGRKNPFVKICGITNVEDALCTAKNGADFLGFIFWNKSKRNVAKENVLKIRNSLEENFENNQIKKMPKLVGVIVDIDREETHEALSLVKENVLDVIQVHTFETAVKFCTDSRFENIPHYCAVNLKSQDDIQKLDELVKLGEPRILVDSQSQKEIGGTGIQINEEILESVAKKYKLLIGRAVWAPCALCPRFRAGGMGRSK